VTGTRKLILNLFSINFFTEFHLFNFLSVYRFYCCRWTQIVRTDTRLSRQLCSLSWAWSSGCHYVRRRP